MTNGRLAAMPQTSERVVVVVDGSPAGATAVRRAAALAGLLHADLVAVVPEPSPTATGDEGRNLREVAADAADFGADVIRVEADDLASAVARLAEARGATHVVIAHRPQGRLDRLRHRPRPKRCSTVSRAWKFMSWARATEQTALTGTTADRTGAGTRPDLSRAPEPHNNRCLRRSARRARDPRP